MSNEILRNDIAIVLDWADVASATKYHCQVSKNYEDFSGTLEEEDNNLATSTISFNLATPANGDKFYWRWKSYVGTTWSKWSEVSMFIYDSTFAADVSANTDKWILINKDLVTDTYEPDLVALHSITPRGSDRIDGENMAGDVLSEIYKVKKDIALDYSGYSFLGEDMRAEILRLYHLKSEIYLGAKLLNSKMTDYRYLVFKVLFANNPAMEVEGQNVLDFKEV